jgi:hypothetical protein
MLATSPPAPTICNLLSGCNSYTHGKGVKTAYRLGRGISAL